MLKVATMLLQLLVECQVDQDERYDLWVSIIVGRCSKLRPL